jgi:multimeric flavodoxin WrbA
LTIVGVSGSPILNGNTDRIVKAVLEQSSREHVFVNLSTLRYDPCRGCAHLCASTNMCPIDDDLQPYYEPLLTSDAIVLGTSVNGGNITAWMYSFLSRLWCFRHVTRLLQDKPVLLVVCGLFRRSKYRVLPKFVERVGSANILGYIYHTTNIPPCFTCGMGKTCRIGGLWEMLGRDEERLKSWVLHEQMFTRWENNPETVARVAEYAEMLKKLAG